MRTHMTYRLARTSSTDSDVLLPALPSHLSTISARHLLQFGPILLELILPDIQRRYIYIYIDILHQSPRRCRPLDIYIYIFPFYGFEYFIRFCDRTMEDVNLSNDVSRKRETSLEAPF